MYRVINCRLHEITCNHCNQSATVHVVAWLRNPRNMQPLQPRSIEWLHGCS